MSIRPTEDRATFHVPPAGTLGQSKPDVSAGASAGVCAGSVSVNGLAVTWSRAAVYYLPMEQLQRLPTVWPLVAAVLQSPTAEKVCACKGAHVEVSCFMWRQSSVPHMHECKGFCKHAHCDAWNLL